MRCRDAVFRLVHVDGEVLGVHCFAVPEWEIGDMIALAGGPLRMLEVEWGDEDDEVAGRPTVEVAEV